MEEGLKTKGGTRAGRPAGDPVDRAVAAIRGAQDRLVRLLASEDEAVGARARVALQVQDPLPIWPLTEALLTARDAGFRLKLIGVLAAMGPVEPIRVVVALGEAVKAEEDMTVKLAALNAMVAVGMATQRACGAPDRGDGPDTRPATSRGEEAPTDHKPGRRGGGTRTT